MLNQKQTDPTHRRPQQLSQNGFRNLRVYARVQLIFDQVSVGKWLSFYSLAKEAGRLVCARLQSLNVVHLTVVLWGKYIKYDRAARLCQRSYLVESKTDVTTNEWAKRISIINYSSFVTIPAGPWQTDIQTDNLWQQILHYAMHSIAQITGLSTVSRW